jgi:hypothetical protein
VSEPFGFDQECNVGEWVENGMAISAHADAAPATAMIRLQQSGADQLLPA